MTHRFEQAIALVDFRFGQRLQAGEAEIFHAIRGNDTTVDDRFTQGIVVDPIGAREIAGERARETIARAGRIVNIFEWVCRRAKEEVIPKEYGTVLPFFDDHVFWAHLQEQATRLDEAGLRSEERRVGKECRS